MPIEYLDGRRFARAVIAGASWVRHRREHLNHINVFPVADGDTGTNMALSLSATAGAMRDTPGRHLGAAAARAAEASILGAKGNSGVIMAHWFLGLARAFGDRKRASAAQVASSLQHASRTVRGAIERPVEGTIVTVMEAVSAHLREPVAGARDDLGALLEQMVSAAQTALSHTPDQLPVLREANVVDAGAQGYVLFLEGAQRELRGEAAPVPTAESWSAAHETLHRGHPEGGAIEERYCTEVVVRGRGFAEDQLKRAFRRMGGSLLVATTGEVFKLHIHTNHPDEVMRTAARLGHIEERKVDDMLRQRQERGAAGGTQPLLALDRQPATVAVLCDSTADLPAAVRREHGIEMAPLQVLFGDRVYRDQVDLSTEEFYRKLVSDAHHPTTSQPPPRAFVEALDCIRPDREAVILTVSGAMSGTWKSARSAARLTAHPRVEVVDTRNASLGHGMITLNAARLAARGASVDDLLHWIGRWCDDSGLVVVVATLEYLRRGGRLGAARSILGGLLGVRPILTLENGEVKALARARSEDDALARALAALEGALAQGERVRIGLISIGEIPALAQVEARLRGRCEVLECVRGAPTGVVGAHVGPGAWGVFYQRVRDDDPLLASA